MVDTNVVNKSKETLFQAIGNKVGNIDDIIKDTSRTLTTAAIEVAGVPTQVIAEVGTSEMALIFSEYLTAAIVAYGKLEYLLLDDPKTLKFYSDLNETFKRISMNIHTTINYVDSKKEIINEDIEKINSFVIDITNLLFLPVGIINEKMEQYILYLIKKILRLNTDEFSRIEKLINENKKLKEAGVLNDNDIERISLNLKNIYSQIITQKFTNIQKDIQNNGDNIYGGGCGIGNGCVFTGGVGVNVNVGGRRNTKKNEQLKKIKKSIKKSISGFLTPSSFSPSDLNMTLKRKGIKIKNKNKNKNKHEIKNKQEKIKKIIFYKVLVWFVLICFVFIFVLVFIFSPVYIII